MELLQIPPQLLNNLNWGWTLMLLSTRFTGMMLAIPGIGEGARGLLVRGPAIMVLSFTCIGSGALAELPGSIIDLVLQAGAEFAFGFMIGLIPLLVLAGVKLAGQLSGTTMGLGAGQLMDPNLGINVSDLSRIFGDLCTVLFLMLGGHHAVIYAVSGMGGRIVPGSFVPGEITLNLMITASSEVFRLGAMVSAPVVVALLLTQFVMGLLTKAVPAVNIFIVSFPLTIGIGLILSMLSLPEILHFVQREYSESDKKMAVFSLEAQEYHPPQETGGRAR